MAEIDALRRGCTRTPLLGYILTAVKGMRYIFLVLFDGISTL